jgi:tRNA(Ile)-lysidine synthase
MESRRVLVGVSGGPDSVALLLGLVDLQDKMKFELLAAHVHHGWRGDAADDDAAWVAELGQRLRVPTEVLAVTPEQKSRHGAKTLEEGARDSRYELLSNCAAKHGCTLVAVGHTSDDQVETVLHHIVRGTGLAGLGGMPAERQLTDAVKLVRPLLNIARTDVLAFLAERRQSFRVDATNADVTLTRNRVRHELLPLLRTKFNRQVDAAILRLSCQASEAAALINELANKLLETALLDESESWARIDARRLAEHSPLLIRQALRELWIRQNWPRQEMGRAEWERLANLVTSPGAVDLPGGLSARRDAGPLVIRRRESVGAANPALS